MKYNHKKIESKWQKKWEEESVYEPNLKNPKKSFYNLMMFPYPSAEGLHVGNMYAFTGSDVYGRFKRMRGNDVFEPIGLDGFGIHSENYAIKAGTHPVDQAKKSEKNFYAQLKSIGNGFAWNEKLETYDPEYYRWTQWIFVQMFKNGLAYRKKAPVNWCPSCMTVLADEQVEGGACERCDSEVVQKDFAQWFFRITDYAERLLNDLENIDWSEKVKIAQKNWIGKSEGAEIDFEIKIGPDPNFVLLHGFKSSPQKNFFPWLKKELESRGYRVQVPALPDPDNPDVKKQIEHVLESVDFDENSIVLGHSLGSVVAMKALEKIDKPIRKLILAAGFVSPPSEMDKERDYEPSFDWGYDFEKIKKNVSKIKILRDTTDSVIPAKQADILHDNLGGELVDFTAEEEHICAEEEPEVLRSCLEKATVFTTRPDTLFGATYIVFAPEHKEIPNHKSQITNRKEVENYINEAKKKKDVDRLAEGEDKSGVELKGIKAVNPATGEEVSVWVADYVLASVGTGAIMAVPAHDERDFEFAKKYDLPIKKVVKPSPVTPPQVPGYGGSDISVVSECWTGEGNLVHSGSFTGMSSEEARRKITEFVGGRWGKKYRLRDWLISRQRYWGPPIPLVFCENCAERVKNQESRIKNEKEYTKGELENPGWVSVPEENLPVELPYVEEFRPTGTDKSPLAVVEDFYKTTCPKCGGEARRETDVSDTFLDSAWYYYRYPSVNEEDASSEIPWNEEITKNWLPVDMYIGGAEHSVLHLLYTRFITKVFHDWGVVDFEEPFQKFRAHGLLIKEGAKMSKSKGNIINPDEYIEKFGADVLRMYLMFLAPFEQGGDFRDESVIGIIRFLDRVWDFYQKNKKAKKQENINKNTEKLFHKTIKKVTEDIESLKYNTAISALMVLLNEIENAHYALRVEHCEVFAKLLAPFAPHLTEEIWRENLGKKESIHLSKWPEYDPKLIKEDTFRLVVQVNGKVRDTLEAKKGISQEEAEDLARKSEKVKKHLEGVEVKKVIFVKDRLISFVVK